MPSRRSYLAGVATLLSGFAGCTNRGGDTPSPTASPTEPSGTDPKGSPSGTATPPPEETQRTVGGATVAVTDIVARKAVPYESTLGSGGVLAADGRQYVVASVHTDADLSVEAFSLRTADEAWTAGLPDTRGAINYAVAGHEGGPVGRPMGGDGPQFVAFEVPSPLDAADPAIRFERNGDSAEWPLPDEAVTALAEPSPSFDLDSLSVPDSVQQGDPLEVELTVTNTSDTSGRFLAAVYWPTELIADDDESHIVEQSVDAGATTTQSLTIDTQYTTDEDGPITLEVAGHVDAETTVEVTDAGTPP